MIPMAFGSISRERLEALDPLDEQFATVDENECIAGPLGNQRGGHHRLAESGRGRQHAVIMRHECVERLGLRAAKRALEA
jgi:hypothetical protein